jgi:uncharacterized protein (TIGR02246 family)
MDHSKSSMELAIENWRIAWNTGDAELAVRDYADDIDWTNAFGVRCRSRPELRATLERLFADPAVMAGRDEVNSVEIRLLKPNVGLATTLVERRGQLTSSGEPLGTRRTTHLRVFVRTDAGWKIVSHLITDARDLERAAH